MANKKDNKLFFFISTLFIVFIFFLPSIFFKVKAYDEFMPFKETYLPVCFSFSEMFELISILGLRQHFEATNTIYSSLTSIRCNPFGNFLQLFIQVLFKKNPINYHLYSIFLHIINSGILFLLLVRVKNTFKNSTDKLDYLIISILTLIWALHPVNLESVLLLSNANIILSYTLSLLSIFLFINSLEEKKNTTLYIILIFISYTMALFTAEFHFFIPIVLISYLTAKDYFLSPNKSFINILKNSVMKCIPFIISSTLFIISFIFSTTRINLNNNSNVQMILERVFWLAPQIIFHFYKIFLFPLKLSIDQTNLVKLGKSIFDPYALFCISIIILVIIGSIISLKNANKKIPCFFLTFSLFLITLLPYSQVLAPIYNLASERYLYFPSLLFFFGIGHVIFYKISQDAKLDKRILIIISILLIIYTGRSYIRTLDWKDSESLYKAAITATNNPLHQAVRYKGLTPQKYILEKYDEKYTPKIYQKIAEKKLEEAIAFYKIEIEKYQDKTPSIIKHYGLDPETLLSKAGYVYAQTKFGLSGDNDYKLALETLKPFIKDLSKLDPSALSFYASILYFNNYFQESEDIMKKAYALHPYSTRIIFPLCDLIQINYRDLNKVEELTLKSFNYYPYDSYTLLVLRKIYFAKQDLVEFARFSYIYGLRNHSLESLYDSYKAYVKLADINNSEKVKKEILFLQKVLKK